MLYAPNERLDREHKSPLRGWEGQWHSISGSNRMPRDRHSSVKLAYQFVGHQEHSEIFGQKEYRKQKQNYHLLTSFLTPSLTPRHLTITLTGKWLEQSGN